MVEDAYYTRPVEVKYIIVQSSYNNRMVAKEKYASDVFEAMNQFQHMGLDTDPEEEPSSFVRQGEIRIIPPTSSGFRLLFFKHSGYTWIDAETAQEKIYYNGNDPEVVQETIRKLSDLEMKGNKYLSGSFVFEMPSDAKPISPHTINIHFLDHLTKTEYCAWFNSWGLCFVKYEPDTKSMIFVYNTSSG
jgi:hypothetical protein